MYAYTTVYLMYIGFSDVTYVDEDLRLMRGNAGNLYVLQKISE